MDLEDLLIVPEWEWPKDAAAVLLDLLRDRDADPGQREVAIELAGSIVVINAELAAALLEILHDPREDEQLRGAAAIAFGPLLEEFDLDAPDLGLDDGPAVPEPTVRRIRSSLRALHHDEAAPTYVRRRALEASVRHMEDWHADAVRAAYRSEDTDWRLTAVFCMAYVPGFEDSILEELGNGDSAIEREAVRAAGSREVAAAWPHIRRILRAPDAVERDLLLAAIEAAAWVRPREAPEYLEPLTDVRDPEIAAAAEDAIGMATAFSGPWSNS